VSKENSGRGKKSGGQKYARNSTDMMEACGVMVTREEKGLSG
jgi:hypothetical protein